jgi:hypothetical protein
MMRRPTLFVKKIDVFCFRAGPPRLQSAQADFVLFQPRLQPPGAEPGLRPPPLPHAMNCPATGWTILETIVGSRVTALRLASPSTIILA